LLKTRFLDADTYDRREKLVAAMGALGDPDALEFLRALLDSPMTGPRLKGLSAKALAKLGDKQSLPKIIRLLEKSGDPLTNRHNKELQEWWAAEALAELGDPQGVPALLEYLKKNKSAKLARSYVVAALGRIRGSDIASQTEALKKLLVDPKEELSVRSSAMASLARLGSLDSSLIASSAPTFRKSYYLSEIAEGLKEGEGKNALPKLQTFYKSAIVADAKPDSGTDAILRVQLELGDEKAKALLKAPREDRYLEQLRLTALAKAGDVSAKKAILTQLETADENTAAGILKNLVEVRDPAAVPLAKKLLLHSSPYIRGEALKLVGVLGATEDEPKVKSAMHAAEGFVQSRAIEALQRLNPERWSSIAPDNLHSAIQHARERRTMRRYSGQEVPATITLESHFPEAFPQQKGGSCHIFAATALFGEACFRETGNFVQASNAYLFYRHLREFIASEGKLSLEKPPGNYTALDGGRNSSETLNRILNQPVCTEEECPFDLNFLVELAGAVHEPRNQIEKEPVSGKTEERYGKLVTAALDSAMKKVMKDSVMPAKKGGFEVKEVHSHDIKKCVEKLAKPLSKENPSPLEGIQILASGTPFICHGTFRFGDVPGQHATLFLGYEFQKDGQIDWLVRDSNHEQIMRTRGPLPCANIVYFPNKPH
jgi:HEAT repeat protein